MRRTPAVVTILATLALLNGVCQAAWLVDIKIPRTFKDLDSRMSMSDAFMARRLNDFKKENLESQKRLRYRGSSWKTSADDQEEAKKELYAVWGESNVRVIDLSASPEPEIAASRPRPAPKVDVKSAQAALTSAGKIFDNSAATGANAGPVSLFPQTPSAPPPQAANPSAPAVATARAQPPAPKTAPETVEENEGRKPLSQLVVAEIIYNETSTLRPQWESDDPKKQKHVSDFNPDSDKELRKARAMMAIIADKRYGNGVAPATDPPASDQMKNEGVKYTWDAVEEAAEAAVEDRAARVKYPKYVMVKGKKRRAPNKDCLHFVNWPSDDPPATPNINKRPTANPRIKDDWPYTQFDKIKYVFGPFRNPYHGGDVPGGKDVNNIYTFVYCGVPVFIK